MKFAKLALAAACALSAQAYALSPAATQAVSSANTLNIGGATSIDGQFAQYISDLCQAGTLDTYRQPGTTDTTRTYSCTTATGISGVPGNTNVRINKASGGSIQGAEGVLSSVPVPVLNVSAANCTLASANNYTCSSVGNGLVELGISDVESELFTLTINGGATATEVAAGTATNITTFGIVVTPDLRNALQQAQGLSVNSEDISDMPSLPLAVIANLFAGKITNWNALIDDSGSPILTNRVEICQRAPGSGTQATLNALILGNACSYELGAGLVGLQPLPDSNNANNSLANPPAFVSPVVHNNVGSSDLGVCLTDLAAAGRTAIGVQSMEKVNETNNGRNNYRYIAIDGVTPTLENVQNGNYRFVSGLTLTKRNGIGGFKNGASDALINQVGRYQDVRDFNLTLKVAASAGQAAIDDASDATGRADVGSLAFASRFGNPTLTGAFSSSLPLYPYNREYPGNQTCGELVVTSAAQKIDVSF